MTVSLRDAVTSLRDVLTESTAQGATTAESVRAHAEKSDYPYPELAAQVFQFLHQKRVNFTRALSPDDISDAFLTLLMDAKAVETLGAGKTQNPWLNVRAILRSTGHNMGKSLLDVYNVVRATGLGYAPSILQLSKDLASLLGAFGSRPAAELGAFVAAQGFPPWVATLLARWTRLRGMTPPTDQDLEEWFADAETMKELREIDGPWEVYDAQASTLRCLRHFGEGLQDLADAVEES